MALPLFWPGRYRFYPIGNTSAVSLTRDLAPETDGTILVLGCGDPRNILYTIFCEPENLNRVLDFTCCDIDPAILARNVILLTLVADNQTSPAIVWNIFFHMRLDAASLAVLVSHCKKLIGISATLKQWRSSEYSHFIRMCTEYTLAELRRHWSLYEAMQTLSSPETSSIERKFSERSRCATPLKVHQGSARSAGPLMTQAIEVCGEHFQKYWSTGGSFTSADDVRNSKLLNPTFVYSLGGEGCSVDYTADPMASFHPASALGVVLILIIASPNRKIPTIRFFAGEATAVCHSLRIYKTTGALSTEIPVAKWNTHFITLDQHEYLAGGAPTAFNVIDTSNLDDHIGCLNVIIATVPLLPSLLFHATGDTTKEFAEYLNTDLSTFGHLLGICPVDYLSGFSSRSNVHELIVHEAPKQEATQFHRITTWKSPSDEKHLLPIFDSNQLGTRLYDMYRQPFEKEEPAYFAGLDETGMRRAIANSNLVREIRETFVLFLKLVRDRLEIPESRWLETMERFFTLFQRESEGRLDQLHRYDFYVCSHLHGVHTATFFDFNVPKFGPMANWDRVPSLVRIILVVPRENLALLEKISESIGTPLLQCEFKGTGRRTRDIFTSVHAAFGKIIPTGTQSRPSVIFNEDPKGRMGNSPLIASFVVVTPLLTVSFAMRGTAGVSLELTKKFGSEFCLFSANIMDKTYVHILPEEPFLTKPQGSQISRPSATTTRIPRIGAAGPLIVEMDEECELVSRLICRVSVDNQEAKHLFGSGSKPGISQRSACVMQLAIGKHTQDITFPFPVIGSKNLLRLARKSLYVEILVPISGPFRSDGMKLNPFPVVGENLALAPWSMHQINLSRLPTLDTGASDVQSWLKPHLAHMLSARERKLTKNHENDALALVKDTIHTIFYHASGTSGGPLRRVFGLRDKPSTEYDTIIFISDVKFDLASHTLVCDGYVLPLTPAIFAIISGEFGKLIQESNIFNVGIYGDEMKAWKQLLPAFAERCRSWKHTSSCEYVAQGKVPLSDEMHYNPLCSCGRGKDVEGMSKVKAWSKFAPLATRIAMSPLFAVSYLESVTRDLLVGRCSVCRRKGKPKMMKCAKCKKVRYCSRECQKKDWDERHKAKCKSV
ncbi:hypothetical protein DFH09DRAFT_1420308 [Mycena vulgaris]|nr:hypothetical protein DFH09DRAFT_1420308 [Mycena vulgaris]